MRCKACNNIMEEHEIIWIEERGEHEELCITCRNIVINQTDIEDDVSGLVYIEDIDCE